MTDREWRETIRIAINSGSLHCIVCGQQLTRKNWSKDHILCRHYHFKVQHDSDNWLPICKDCNTLKADKPLWKVIVHMQLSQHQR